MNFRAEQAADISWGWKHCYPNIPARDKTQSLLVHKPALAGNAWQKLTPSTKGLNTKKMKQQQIRGAMEKGEKEEWEILPAPRRNIYQKGRSVPGKVVGKRGSYFCLYPNLSSGSVLWTLKIMSQTGGNMILMLIKNMRKIWVDVNLNS